MQFSMQDGLLGKVFHQDGDKIKPQLVMNTSIRNAILHRNQELKKSPGVIQDLSFGRQQLSIPVGDYWLLRKANPDLFEGDIETRKKALQKFMNSSASAPYRIR